MSIGILGGTFNPIHNGHVHLAKDAVVQLSIDKLFLVPSGNPPHKEEQLDKYHRFNMAKLVAEEGGFNVSDYEIKKETPSYTIDTVAHFISLFNERIVFIVGADSLSYIEEWKHWNKLSKLCVIAAAGRLNEDYSIMSKMAEDLNFRYGAKIVLIKNEHIDISSTEIRDLVGQGMPISGLVPVCVEQYIKENKLYII